MRNTKRKKRNQWYVKADTIFLTILLVIIMSFCSVLVICADMVEHPEISGADSVEEVIEDILSA